MERLYAGQWLTAPFFFSCNYKIAPDMMGKCTKMNIINLRNDLSTYSTYDKE